MYIVKKYLKYSFSLGHVNNGKIKKFDANFYAITQ